MRSLLLLLLQVCIVKSSCIFERKKNVRLPGSVSKLPRRSPMANLGHFWQRLTRSYKGTRQKSGKDSTSSCSKSQEGAGNSPAPHTNVRFLVCAVPWLSATSVPILN